MTRAWPLAAIASGADPAAAVADWLSAAPIEQFVPSAAEGDLASVANFFGFDSDARHRIGARLLEVCPNQHRALADAGFTVPTQTN